VSQSSKAQGIQRLEIQEGSEIEESSLGYREEYCETLGYHTTFLGCGCRLDRESAGSQESDDENRSDVGLWILFGERSNYRETFRDDIYGECSE